MSAGITKSKILDAAEQRFAVDGFATTSLRTVTADAGVNLAAVNYHFGSKEKLIEAVFARRLRPINDARLRLLDQAEASVSDGSELRVETILAIFVGPIFQLSVKSPEQSSTLMAIIGRVHTEHDDQIRELLFRQFSEVATRYIGALSRALPSLSPEELHRRFHYAIGAMAAATAAPERLAKLSNNLVEGAFTREAFSDLVAFLAAGFRAEPLNVDDWMDLEGLQPQAGVSQAGGRS